MGENNLSRLRPMLNQHRILNGGTFTLKLSVVINGTVTVFDNITVSKMELPPNRKITQNEEAQNINNDDFECGICLESFLANDSVSELLQTPISFKLRSRMDSRKRNLSNVQSKNISIQM